MRAIFATSVLLALCAPSSAAAPADVGALRDADASAGSACVPFWLPFFPTRVCAGAGAAASPVRDATCWGAMQGMGYLACAAVSGTGSATCGPRSGAERHAFAGSPVCAVASGTGSAGCSGGTYISLTCVAGSATGDATCGGFYAWGFTTCVVVSGTGSARCEASACVAVSAIGEASAACSTTFTCASVAPARLLP